jgi:glycosyltransferase involved in cell wall biosynthesis
LNFLFFSTAAWDWGDGAQPGPRLSLELARRGHQVSLVQPLPSPVGPLPLPVKILSLSDLGLSEAAANRAWHGLDAGSLEVVAQNLTSRVRDRDQPDAPRFAAWFAPFEPFARLLPVVRALGYRLFYYPQDDFAAMVRLGAYRHNLAAENCLAQQAEAILTLSATVAEKMRCYGKPVYVIPDGIDLDEFRPSGQAPKVPPNVLRGERTLGFWGWLDETMVDPEPLRYVARERPTWAIHLIGGSPPEAGRPSLAKALADFQNIHIHGQLPHRDLCELGSCFDACLIPAPDNDFSRGRDPLKTYEYLALYKPVITTHMPQLAGMPYVRNASSPSEFLQEIETALRTPIDVPVVDAFLARQTWAARADALLDVIRSLGERGPSAPPGAPDISTGSLVLPAFAPSPGLTLYLDRLEADLAETRRWARDLEAAVIAKDRELKRIYDFLPIRILRRLYHLFV